MSAKQSLFATLKLQNLFGKNVQLKHIQLTIGGTIKTVVPDGKAWILVGGYWAHITGTTTQLFASDLEGNAVYWVSNIPSGQASGLFPLYNNLPVGAADTTAIAALHPFMIFTQGKQLNVSGGVGAGIVLLILEFDAL